MGLGQALLRLCEAVGITQSGCDFRPPTRLMSGRDAERTSSDEVVVDGIEAQ